MQIPRRRPILIYPALGIKENGWGEGKIWLCLWPLNAVTKNPDRANKALYLDTRRSKFPFQATFQTNFVYVVPTYNMYQFLGLGLGLGAGGYGDNDLRSS